MRRQSFIALGVALVLGLVAVYLANVVLSSSQQQTAASELTRIAVAAAPMEYGTQLTAENIRFANYPKSSVPQGSFQTMQELMPNGAQRIVLVPLQPNEPILASKLSGAGQNASIAALLPDGMRAASVRINDVSGVAGFVMPNDSVDVLITRQFSSGNNSQQITDLLLQNVRVIAIGQRTKGEDGKPALARSATLEVDPLAAQKLALAQEIGSLSLVLRKPGFEQDTGHVETVSLTDLRYNRYGRPQMTTTAAPRTAARAAPTARTVVTRRAPARTTPPPPPRSNNVEVVRGVQGRDYEVGDYDS